MNVLHHLNQFKIALKGIILSAVKNEHNIKLNECIFMFYLLCEHTHVNIVGVLSKLGGMGEKRNLQAQF